MHLHYNGSAADNQILSDSFCSVRNNNNDYTSLVDPMIGTGGHGHTFPGATVPFGMVQISPDTRWEDWDGSSGYHYSDKTIMGFSQTHLSGTGAPEYCDVLFMPTVGDVQILPGDENNPKTGYRSAFSHDNEKASPGYYSVLLDDDHIKAELTATTRSGFHRYTFPASEQSNIIIDLKNRDHVLNQTLKSSAIPNFRDCGVPKGGQTISMSIFMRNFQNLFTFVRNSIE